MPAGARFRAEARTWLEQRVPVKGGPDDVSNGFLVTVAPDEFSARTKASPWLLVEHGACAGTALLPGDQTGRSVGPLSRVR